MPVTRTVNGETRTWDGGQWVAAPTSAEAGYHPGLEDSGSPWLARIKGFLSGASEAATPGKVGTLAALAVPGAAPAALVGGGAMALADMLRTHFDTANAPKSMGDAAMDVGGAALGAGIKGPISKGYELASNVVKNPRALTGGTGAVVGGLEGYKRDGIPGALGGAVAGGLGATMLGKRLGLISDAIAPEAGATAESSVMPSAVNPRLSREVPGFSYPEAAPIPEAPGEAIPGLRGNNPPNSPRPGGKSPGLTDTLKNALDGLSGGNPSEAVAQSGKLADTPSVRSFERENMLRNSHFADGGVMPAGPGARPTELYDLATTSQEPQGFDWPEAGGRYEPDANGSHVLSGPVAATADQAAGPEFQQLGDSTPPSIAALDHPQNPDVMPKAFSDGVEELANQERLEGFPNQPAKWQARVPKVMQDYYSDPNNSVDSILARRWGSR